MISLTINDMTCGGCVASITRIIKALDPAATVDANVEARRVNIASPLASDTVVAAITQAGYHPQIAA